MANPFNTNEFKRLQAKWYSKLAQSGFVDAERTVNGSPVLKQRAVRRPYTDAAPVQREAKEDYFSLLSSYTEREAFEDPADEIIMRMRSAGARIREISEELAKKGLKSHRETIRYVIRKYENQWGIKVWKKNQIRW